MLKRIFIITIALLIALSISGCGPMVYQEKAGGEVARAIQVTEDGSCVLAITQSRGDNISSVLLTKTDKHGNVQWSQDFGEDRIDMQAYSLQQTVDGGFILAGIIKPDYQNNAFLLKTDSKGEKQWIKTFGGDKSDYAYSAEQTSDGGYIVAGYTYSFAQSRFAAWLIKTDGNGNEQWSRVFSGDKNYYQAFCVSETSDGGYIVLGYEESPDYTSTAAWLLKTDKDGVEQWSNTFGGDTYGEKYYGYALRQTSDGGFIFVKGAYPYYSHRRSEFILVKTDDNGAEQFSQIFQSNAREMKAHSLQQTKDNGYVLTGTMEQQNIYSAFLIKTDHAGQEEWRNLFGSESEDIRAYGLQQTDDGSYILAGTTRTGQQDVSQAWLLKTDENGNEQWSQAFGEEYVAGYELNPLVLIALVLIFSILILNLIIFWLCSGDMKRRNERYRSWVLRFLFLGPLAVTWYRTYRKPADGGIIRGSRLHNLAKNFAINWGIYLLLLPILFIVLFMFVKGPGFMLLAGLALLIEFKTGVLLLIIYIFLVWLAPTVISVIIMLVTMPRKSIKRNK